jgi:hypothetical protein
LEGCPKGGVVKICDLKINSLLNTNTLALMEGKILAIFMARFGMTAGNSS